MQAEEYRFRRFVRNKLTGKFLGREGVWTSNISEAAEFEDALSMLDYCHAHNLTQGIQVFLQPTSPNAQEVVADLF